MLGKARLEIDFDKNSSLSQNNVFLGKHSFSQSSVLRFYFDKQFFFFKLAKNSPP